MYVICYTVFLNCSQVKNIGSLLTLSQRHCRHARSKTCRKYTRKYLNFTDSFTIIWQNQSNALSLEGGIFIIGIPQQYVHQLFIKTSLSGNLSAKHLRYCITLFANELSTFCFHFIYHVMMTQIVFLLFLVKTSVYKALLSTAQYQAPSLPTIQIE